MSKKPFFKTATGHFILLILVLVACWSIGSLFNIDQQSMRAWFDAVTMVVAAPLFILAYVGLTFIIWFAKDILKIVGAVVFGAYISTALIWMAEMMNVVILFHLSRWLGRQFIIDRFHISEEQIAAAQRNTKVIQLFVFRSIPLIPFRFLDLGYGLTGVPFNKYALIAAIASPVRIFWIQFVLAGVGDAMMEQGLEKSIGLIMQYFMDHMIVMQWSLLYLGVSFVLVVGMKIAGKVNKS